MPKKVATIVGVRPQFIKAVLVSKKIRAMGMSEILIHTGQHYDFNMSASFFKELDIPELNYNLGVGSGGHGEQTGLMLKKIEEALIKEKPNMVLVYGDTNSTLAGALAASKLNIRLAHIEAGLRNYDKTVPEEINRIVADHVSDLLFCPTKMAMRDLAIEGLAGRAYLVGDVMYDTALQYGKLAEQNSSILNDVGVKPKQYFLVTVHRPHNVDVVENLDKVVGILNHLPMDAVLPLHPRTHRMMSENNIKIESGRCKVVHPVPYLDMLMLEKNAKMILTDSGGVQKEAYFFKVPCVTLLKITEWVETVESGWNVLTGLDEDKVMSAIKNMDVKNLKHENYYGDGDAVGKIAEIIAR